MSPQPGRGEKLKSSFSPQPGRVRPASPWAPHPPDHRPASHFSLFLLSPFFPSCAPNRRRQRRRRLGRPRPHRPRTVVVLATETAADKPSCTAAAEPAARATGGLPWSSASGAGDSSRRALPTLPHRALAVPRVRRWQGRVRRLLASTLAAHLAGSRRRRPRRSSRRRPGTRLLFWKLCRDRMAFYFYRQG
jgi:hypothetical protein